MILRKPYAFLIKHFRLINTIILLLVIFLFTRNLGTHSFVKEYLVTTFYNSSIESIEIYLNPYFYISSIVVLIFSGTLILLLRYKEKPYLSYVYIFIVYAFLLGVSLYTKSYFSGITSNSMFSVASTRVIRDLLFIASIPQYPALILLVIRALGIDLKRFGFQEDKEFAEIKSEDNEEFEFEVAFDQDRVKRTAKQKLRYLKYYIIEHKRPIILATVLGTLFVFYGMYKFVFVENKIYKTNETLSSNNYEITLRNTYITDKDFAGNKISKDNQYYVVVNVDIKNTHATSRVVDIEKFYLYVGNRYYVPTVRFNPYFVDMGNLFRKDSIPGGKSENYNMIFEIDPPTEKSNFYLSYQNVTNKSKIIKFRTKVIDISSFKEKDHKSLKETLEVPLNQKEKNELTIFNYEIGKNFAYNYQKCNITSCPIVEEQTSPTSNNSVLYLKGNFGEISGYDFTQFASKYGKIRYKIGDTTYVENIKSAVDKKYKGNYLYFLVPENIQNATEIEVYFTIRTYQYFYKLKG